MIRDTPANIVRNPNNQFMEPKMSTILGRMPHIGVCVSDHMKVHYQFHTIFLQTHQEILYLIEIFQSVHSRFLDFLDHLLKHPALVDDTETATPTTSTSQDYSKRSILSGLGEIVMSIFGDESSGGKSYAIIKKIKRNWHNLHQNQI